MQHTHLCTRTTLNRYENGLFKAADPTTQHYNHYLRQLNASSWRGSVVARRANGPHPSLRGFFEEDGGGTFEEADCLESGANLHDADEDDEEDEEVKTRLPLKPVYPATHKIRLPTEIYGSVGGLVAAERGMEEKDAGA